MIENEDIVWHLEKVQVEDLMKEVLEFWVQIQGH